MSQKPSIIRPRLTEKRLATALPVILRHLKCGRCKLHVAGGNLGLQIIVLPSLKQPKPLLMQTLRLNVML